MNKEVKVLIGLAAVCWSAFYLTGCAGVELGGKLGMYRVDEKKESQATYARNTRPLSCMFWNSQSCKQAAQRYDEEQGS